MNHRAHHQHSTLHYRNHVTVRAPSTALRQQPTLRVGVLCVKYGGRRPPMPPPPLSRWRMKRDSALQTLVSNTATYPLTPSPFTLHSASSRSRTRTPAGDTGWRSESGSRGRRLVTSAPGRLGHHACRHYDRHARCIAASGAGAGGEIPRRLPARSPAKPGPTLSLWDE